MTITFTNPTHPVAGYTKVDNSTRVVLNASMTNGPNDDFHLARHHYRPI